MAGDWLKFEAATPDKAETLAITAAMGWDDVDLTVGKLFRVWRWFDQQTTDGNARSVTSALLDRIAGAPGFARAMQDAGWLIISDSGLILPNFERHNGKTAKARALSAIRTGKSKAKSNGEGNGESVTSSVTSALPREEKRREEKKPTKKSGREQVEEFVVDDDLRAYAQQRGHDADALLEDWRDYCRANGYLAGRNPIRDARAMFQRWIRNANTVTQRRPRAVPDSSLTVGASTDSVTPPDVDRAYRLVIKPWIDEHPAVPLGRPGREAWEEAFTREFGFTPRDWNEQGPIKARALLSERGAA
jgi:hypothetical protein